MKDIVRHLGNPHKSNIVFNLLAIFAILFSGLIPYGTASSTAAIPPGMQTPAQVSLTDISGVSAPGAAATPFFLYKTLDPDQSPWPWFESQTVVDKAGGSHTIYFTNDSIYYAYCMTGCANRANWSNPVAITASNPAGSNARPSLAVDLNHHPRIVWYYDSSDFIYAECNASCTQSSGWSAQYKVEVGFSAGNYPVDNGYFAINPQGHPRFMLPLGGSSFKYLNCSQNCTQGNWSNNSIKVSGFNTIGAIKMVFNAQGQPRALGLDSNDNLVYLECKNTMCTQDADWSGVSLDNVGGYLLTSPYSLGLDSHGRPRVAYYKAAVADRSLYYAWSNASSTTRAGWQAYTLDLNPGEWKSVGLAFDSHDLPRLVYPTLDGDLGYALCTSACQSMHPQWQAGTIETVAQMDAREPMVQTGDLAQHWMVEGWLSLAVDSADHASVSYYVTHDQYNKNDTSGTPDAWSIRYAGSGTVPGPKYSVFLPLMKR